MPEDIPEPAVRLTEDEIGWRASDWTDFRRDYASTDDAVRKREYLAFLAGWDARHLSTILTPAQQAAVDRVREMVTGSSLARLSVIEAIRDTAEQEADRAALDALPESHRGLVEEMRRRLAEAATADPEPPSEEAPGDGKMSPADLARANDRLALAAANEVRCSQRALIAGVGERCIRYEGHDGKHLAADRTEWVVPAPRPIPDRPQA